MSNIYVQQNYNAQEVNSTASHAKKADSSAYEQILNDQLNQIINLCQEVGTTDGKDGAEKASNSSQTNGSGPLGGISPSQENKIIHHDNIFYALLVVFYTGDNSCYHVLAQKMGNINEILKEISSFNGDIQQIEDDLNKIMKGDGNPADLANNIAKMQADLENLLQKDGSSLSPDLQKAIHQFCDSGTGSLDQLVKAATGGKDTTWAQAANDPNAMKQIAAYMNGTGGGATPAAVTTVFSNISGLMGSLNTMNQAQMESLNLLSQKVDSTSKLLASAMTMFQGISQLLTNYAGN